MCFILSYPFFFCIFAAFTRMTLGTVSCLLALVLLLQLTVPAYAPISCYSCDWDQQSGCKLRNVNKKYLETNCTACYKNIVPYKIGLGAASGTVAGGLRTVSTNAVAVLSVL